MTTHLSGGGGLWNPPNDLGVLIPPFCGGPPRVGGGGGAVRGMVAVGTPLGGLGLGDRGDEGVFLRADKLVPESDVVSSRLGGGGGGPLLPPPLLPKRFVMEEVESDIFRPTVGGGAGGVTRLGGGGGPPSRRH